MGLFLGAAALVVGGVGGAAAGADLAVSPSAAGAGPGRPGEGVEGRPTADLNVLVRDDADDDGDGDGPGAGPSAHPTTTALPRPSGSRPGNPDPSRSSRPSEGSDSPSTSPTPGPHEPGAPDESGEAHGGDGRDGLPQDDPATRHPDSGLPSLAAEPGGADGGTATRTETLVGTQAGTLPPAPSRSLSPSGSGFGFRPYGDARAGAEPGAGRESASAAVRGSAQADVAAGGFQQSRVLPFGTGLALIGLGAAVLGVRLRRS